MLLRFVDGNEMVSFIDAANIAVPKGSIIAFSSFPDYSDNAYELYRHILENREDITGRYSLVWLAEEPPVDGLVGSWVKKRSIRGVWTFLRSRVICHTHGFLGRAITRSGRGQIIANLWHGCGYKAITDEDRKGVYYGDCNFVTGGPYAGIHSGLFGIPKGRVFETGLPRNDVLFEDSDALRVLGIRREDYGRVYLWMPTYRRAAFGHGGTDGSASGFGIGALSWEDYAALDEALSRASSLLVIKPHPMDSAALEGASGLSRIRCVTNEDLGRAGVRLYGLLAESDALWSDYSSVIVDYLLLDRPVVLTLSDRSEYASTRGFVFEDVDRYLPGPVIPTLEELIAYVEDPGPTDSGYEGKRRAIAGEFHRHADDRSAERVCNVLFGAPREGGGLVEERNTRFAR